KIDAAALGPPALVKGRDRWAPRTEGAHPHDVLAKRLEPRRVVAVLAPVQHAHRHAVAIRHALSQEQSITSLGGQSLNGPVRAEHARRRQSRETGPPRRQVAVVTR